MSKKKKSIAALGAAIAEHEKNNNNAPSSAVQQLVEAFISTKNPEKRAKKIAEIKLRCEGINKMLTENKELLTAEIEQALIRAANGYTVTERKIRIVNGLKTVETAERYIPPSQAAIEFYLTNNTDSYSRSGSTGQTDGEGRVEQIMEAFRNA